ncbi:dTDP-4-dehydrorhamnose reductase [Mariniplasma anaerobium]|uniref:dTDP-4-dehydrorhamnose reductase n=1 Tax=Mariniplasma anaerobium TaxID=2735436 RepID=A0A7U9TI01_9MOLU|nr:dTDP-4-dehydrorhamnose reductase [Mariniplasma anaerobium]BCR36086.1 NAD(P)-dependent oxidoreductase [Mariniplasma anaerobium]
MKVIVTGVKGQLGYDVVRELKKRNYDDILGIDVNDLDITDSISVIEFMKKEKPDVIIHCAAYTAVDNAEDNEAVCYDVNVNGTKYLVDAAKIQDAKFVYISTDYVFSGDKEGQYEITDKPNPKSVYGRTKYLGEIETLNHSKHFIVRISWVFGKNGNNFIKTMLRLGSERDELSVVSDQIGSPTYTYDLSRLIVDMIETEKFGIYHATNEGICNWYEFAKEIFNLTSININLKPIKTSQYPTKATRPMNSSMSKQSLVDNDFKLLESWQDAIKRYLKEIEVK